MITSVKPTLIPASTEQLKIVAAIRDHNVIVDSVAGAGKTTTILHIAEAYSNLSILILTYNKKLKLDTRHRADQLSIRNLEVHTYHSFCKSHYRMKGYTDYEIINLLKSANLSAMTTAYDIIVIDETQDMTGIYHSLTLNILANNTPAPRICIIGDRYQSIYKYNGADEKYIINADQLFPSKGDWVRLTLSVSYRVKPTVAKFINNCALGTDRILTPTSTPSTMPEYIIGNMFSPSGPLEYLKKYIVNLYNKGRHTDVFILAPSLKVADNLTPVRRLANTLTKLNIPLHVPNSDEEKIDQDMIAGKLTFSTFHQAKGLERAHVIVFGFDAAYYQFFNRHADPTICSNELYVAMTRSSGHLILLHHNASDYLPFLNISELTKYANVSIMNPLKLTNMQPKPKATISVTNLIKHIDSQTLYDVYSSLTITSGKSASAIQIAHKITSTQVHVNDLAKGEGIASLHEGISDITGIAVPAYYEYLKCDGFMTILKHILTKKVALPDLIQKYDLVGYDFIVDLMEPKMINMTITQLLRIVTLYNAISSGYYFRLKQIESFDWITEPQLLTCTARLTTRIHPQSVYEYPLTIDISLDSNTNITIVGIVDVFGGNTLFEIKTVESLSKEHMLQLACYAYMNKKLSPNANVAYKLYNVLTDEEHELHFDLAKFEKSLHLLIRKKL